MENLTVVVPFWNGYGTIGALVNSLPAGLPVVIVDDRSDRHLRYGDVPSRKGLRILHPPRRGYFSGAVNAGLDACETDVLVLNQDVAFTSTGWQKKLDELRQTHAVFGDGVMRHPAWPNGYVQGTFMFMRRDAIDQVGHLNVHEYPLWGSTCEWQLRACRAGFLAKPSTEWRQWLAHEGRHHGRQNVRNRKSRFGGAITEALNREPDKSRLFIRTPPAISVIMPCYNYGRYLKDAVNSLVGGDTSLGHRKPQTLQSFEVIIVDDASTDDSWQYAQALVDPWKAIHAIRLPGNRGTPGAINAGISRARGEYIHILSADDMRDSWGLEVLYKACRENPGAVAYGNVRIFKHGKIGRTLVLPQYDFDKLLHKNPMPAGIMYPRKAWQEVGGYPEEMVYGREDWAFNIRLGAAGWCGLHIGMSGNLYRREGQNRSLRTGNQHRGEAGSGFSWRKTFVDQLRALYPQLYEGERPMPCCGGRASQRSAQTTAPRAAQPVAAEGTALLEYVGGNSGDSSWIANGTEYIAGGTKKIVTVKAADAKVLLDIRIHRRPQFKRAKPKPAPRQQPVIPPEKAIEANPVAPDDLTKVMGVGEVTAAKLLEAGYTTFLELARADAGTLAEHADISSRQAKAATSGARDLV